MNRNPSAITLHIENSETPVDIQDGAGWWGYITQVSPWSFHASDLEPSSIWSHGVTIMRLNDTLFVEPMHYFSISCL